MGVFKEHANVFETIIEFSSQIYNDAADFGVAYNTKNPPDIVKNAIYFANKLKNTSLMKNRTEYKNGVDMLIEIAWEVDEGIECGTEYTISYNRISGPHRFDKTANAMISVNCKNYRKPYKK